MKLGVKNEILKFFINVKQHFALVCLYIRLLDILYSHPQTGAHN